MISDEPWLYFPGKFGIRCENLITCRKAEKTEYGQFMEFEALTMVPFDLELVDLDGLSNREKKLLNDYHAKVCQAVAPYLNPEEVEWLKTATREI